MRDQVEDFLQECTDAIQQLSGITVAHCTDVETYDPMHANIHMYATDYEWQSVLDQHYVKNKECFDTKCCGRYCATPDEKTPSMSQNLTVY